MKMNERKIVTLSEWSDYDEDNYGVMSEVIQAYEVVGIGVIIYTTITKWGGRPETQNTFLPNTKLNSTEDSWFIVPRG
jgi:hypothetical protein